MKHILVCMLAVIPLSCSPDDGNEVNKMNEMKDRPKSEVINSGLLALGDSYTIGERVTENERWPIILKDSLASKGITLNPVTIVATTGWTTGDLKKGISQSQISQNTYDLVSLLIGVNNQYRGYDIAIFEKEFEELLLEAIGFAGQNREKVFVMSIPDYGVTPFGLSMKEKTAKEIDEYNQVIKTIVGNYKIKYFDITPISRQAETDRSLIASDGLHPSAVMYQKWVNLILPWAQETLQ